MTQKNLIRVVGILGLLFLAMWLPASAQTLPDKFTVEKFSPPMAEPAGIHFDERGHLYILEKRGRVRIMIEDSLLATPLVDIQEEVGNWRDHGLLGFAL
ncbi:MAG: hypothetical protein AAF804_17995, partial [Bacteroidota bacterium]